MQYFLLLFFVLFTPLTSVEEQVKDVYFCEMVASGNDWLIDKGQRTPVFKPFTWVTTRAMSVSLFPACTAIDLAILTVKQAKETPHLLMDRDPVQRQLHLDQYKKNKEAFKRTSLGLFTAPMGIISPDIVTQHFIPKNIQTFKLTPYGKLYSSRAHLVFPESAYDVQLIIHEALTAGKSISVIGKFMSQGKQAISNQDWNVVINTSKLNYVVVDPHLKEARVGAGASWADLQNAANKCGLAVRVMQASNIFSVGGSISANCHGWDYKTGCLRNTIKSLTLVDAQGRLLEVSASDPLFDYIIGGYGSIGVIVEATIFLTDNVEMVENGIEVLPRDYVEYFNRNIRQNHAIDMHLYRLSLEPKHLFQTGVAVNYQRLGDERIIADLVDEPERGNRMDRVKLHTLRRFFLLRNLAWRIEKKGALSEKISSRNEIMRPPINPIFNNSKIDSEWLQEYFVRGENLSDFLKFLANILQENNVGLFNASVRFVKHDPKTILSYAPDGDRFAVVLFFNQKLSPQEVRKTKNWVRQVIDYLIVHGGTYYLPYHHFATLEQFRACYPNWESMVLCKHSIDPNGLFDNGLYADYFASDMSQDSKFRQVFNRMNGQREGISDFLNNIFMQLDERKFFSLIDSVLDDRELDDQQIYTALYNKIGEAKSNAISNLQQTLQSLKSLKADLGDQTALLLGQKKINGYVEIGYPGRMTRPLKERLEMKGPFYVITDKETVSDYVEAGFPRPYDKFIPLNDYNPIPESAIPSNSVDLVCIYIGLHHSQKEKIDPFIVSIKRILRPGGTFILMDHDAHTKELRNLVDVVHSIFNAATGVEPEVNSQEIRNFHSLKYWINRVENNGLTCYSKDPLIRKGDSTLNSLVRFDKPMSESTPETITESLILLPDFNRPQKQTYLTAPEWQNVRAAQRYAEFVEHDPSYRYPYFSEIGGFWKVYGKSWQAAQSQNGFTDVALSDYNLMNLFVGTTMTLEYGTKGLIAAPFALIDKVVSRGDCNADKSTADRERLRSLKAYGKYIENTPFYKYPYFKDIGSYWRTYLKEDKSIKSGLNGFLKGTGMTVEYALKGLIAAPMSLVYGSESIKEAETTHLLIHDPDNIAQSIDPDIIVVETFPEYNLKHIEIPRYMRFTEVMQTISDYPSIACVNIAGQSRIQVDVRSLGNDKNIKLYPGCRYLYRIPSPTDLEHTSVALDVDVNQLCSAIRALKLDGVEILFVHDY